MARRGRNRDATPPIRSALGIAWRDHALENVDFIVRRTIHTMVPQAFSGDDALNMLFRQETLAKLRAAYDLVSEADRGVAMSSLPMEPCVNLIFKRPNKYKILSPCRAAMQHTPLSDYHVRAVPLASFIDGARAIIEDYSIVKHVVNWLDNNATMGAMRYYLPGIATLLPKDFEGFSSELAQRFRELPSISTYIPAIRDAGPLLAKAVMLPSGREMPRNTGFELSYSTQTFERYDRTWTTFPYSIMLEDIADAD